MPRYFAQELSSPEAMQYQHLRDQEVTTDLLALLDGLDLDAATVEERLTMRAAVNAVDPLRLVFNEQVVDEYDPEVDHLVALARAGRLTSEAVEAVFTFWFGSLAATPDPAVWASIANAPIAVPYRPGDRFTGVDRDWLLDRLVLDPVHGRVHLSPHEDPPDLACLLYGDEIDVLEEREAVPLGPGVDFWQHPVATVGNPGAMRESVVSATLYQGGSWLVSIWPEVHEDYLPLAPVGYDHTGLGGLAKGVWDWVVEMVGEWASMGGGHDLPVVSPAIDAHDRDQCARVAEAARGGLGTVTVNGVDVRVAGAGH
jgi:hypothetical protein